MSKHERKHKSILGLRTALGGELPKEQIPKNKIQVTNWLLSLRDDPYYKINPIPMTKLEHPFIMIGKTNYEYARQGVNVRGGPISNATARSLETLMNLVIEGRLVFWRGKRNKQDRGARFRYEIIPYPERTPLPQPVLLLREDYNYWARCKSCGGRRFVAVKINSTPHACCIDCLPPKLYGSVGAAPDPNRLVMDIINDSERLGMSQP